MFLFSALLFYSCKKEKQNGTVNSGNNVINHPPVANAGMDQTIQIGSNTILDGSGSSDSDHNKITYKWRNISGAGSATIENDMAVTTNVKISITGSYKFELKVTDPGGLFDLDTVSITTENGSCEIGNRPIVLAQLVPIGTLSSAREGISVATAGDKIVFAGGVNSHESSSVDIYDISRYAWSTASLSAARSEMAVIAAGNKIFFAGGGYLYGDDYYSNVDVYDANLNTWTTTNLSEIKTEVGAAVVGDKVFFAGGFTINGLSNKVDIFDMTTNHWSTDTMNLGRAVMCGVTIGQKIYFAGGYESQGGSYGSSKRIDIYDNATHSWSNSTLSYLNNNNYNVYGLLAGVAVGENIFLSGEGCAVEVYNSNSGTSNPIFLNQKDAYISVIKDGKIIFFHYNSKQFDIYDPASGQWSVGLLPYPITPGAAIISVNNTIYVAGGTIGCTPIGNGTCSPVAINQVYKLEF